MLVETTEKPCLRLLLDHFALIEDDREAWRVAHPLPEVLLLVVCGTIAAGDDFEDIVDWGADNLAFLRRFLPYHHGIPGSRWLRMLMNRIDPGLFAECFRSWAAALRPDAPDLVAIDGKTARGSHDRGNGRAALHLVSAFATRERLVLGQQAVAEGSCEQETIPLLLDRLAAEWPGILAWAIEGCLEWQHIGLSPPPAVQAATASYLADEDTIGLFLAERCATDDPNASTEVKDLFAAWTEWSARAGEFTGSVKRFSTALAARGLQRGHDPITRRAVIHGVRLIDRASPFGPGDIDDPVF